jgi:hypothetical protein
VTAISGRQWSTFRPSQSEGDELYQDPSEIRYVESLVIGQLWRIPQNPDAKHDGRRVDNQAKRRFGRPTGDRSKSREEFHNSMGSEGLMAWYLWNGQGKAYHQRSMCNDSGPLTPTFTPSSRAALRGSCGPG